MTRLDMFWHSNKDWYIVEKDFEFKIKEDAPQEAKESFERYLKQIKEKGDAV